MALRALLCAAAAAATCGGAAVGQVDPAALAGDDVCASGAAGAECGLSALQLKSSASVKQPDSDSTTPCPQSAQQGPRRPFQNAGKAWKKTLETVKNSALNVGGTVATSVAQTATAATEAVVQTAATAVTVAVDVTQGALQNVARAIDAVAPAPAVTQPSLAEPQVPAPVVTSLEPAAPAVPATAAAAEPGPAVVAAESVTEPPALAAAPAVTAAETTAAAEPAAVGVQPAVPGPLDAVASAVEATAGLAGTAVVVAAKVVETMAHGIADAAQQVASNSVTDTLIEAPAAPTGQSESVVEQPAPSTYLEPATPAASVVDVLPILEPAASTAAAEVDATAPIAATTSEVVTSVEPAGPATVVDFVAPPVELAGPAAVVDSVAPPVEPAVAATTSEVEAAPPVPEPATPAVTSGVESVVPTGEPAVFSNSAEVESAVSSVEPA